MPGTVQSVERAAAMLQLLAAEDEPLGLVQIADALGLAKGTAHGLLRTLAEVGFVDQEPGSNRYRVAPDLFRLGAPKLDLNEIRARALNWTDALAARTGESAWLAAFRDRHAVIAHHVFRAGGGSQVLATGTEIPLHATALGKVLLAFDPGAARSQVGVTPDAFTRTTVIDRTGVLRMLAGVRDQGWAAEVDEYRPGTAGIASPVRERGGYVVASVGITGAVDRICDERSRPRGALVTEVQRAARSISREFGHGRTE
ncbi:helix-turn-helix domain-containing protein [Nakamurella sp. YIM 132087]|uniref:Glycerol operon regulatory protein n=1 Tax=Nakamurella alba TaxID=2665158 RepID=A0A7K1FQQ9_9ACTN|nr:IclR family transcriptional regulator [Nakamurella alba]MTD16476.1 helix-turn-helix domain-containing protein [Nakamurella alba]